MPCFDPHSPKHTPGWRQRGRLPDLVPPWAHPSPHPQLTHTLLNPHLQVGDNVDGYLTWFPVGDKTILALQAGGLLVEYGETVCRHVSVRPMEGVKGMGPARSMSPLGACSPLGPERRLDSWADWTVSRWVGTPSSGARGMTSTRADSCAFARACPRLPTQAGSAQGSRPRSSTSLVIPCHSLSPTPPTCLSRSRIDMATAAPYGLVTRVPEDCAVQLVGANGLPATREDGSDVAEVRIIEADGAFGEEREESGLLTGVQPLPALYLVQRWFLSFAQAACSLPLPSPSVPSPRPQAPCARLSPATPRAASSACTNPTSGASSSSRRKSRKRRRRRQQLLVRAARWPCRREG